MTWNTCTVREPRAVRRLVAIAALTSLAAVAVGQEIGAGRADPARDRLNRLVGGAPDHLQRVADTHNLGTGTFVDCNGNGEQDVCDLLTADCNANGIPDDCDITDGLEFDCDASGVPDSCELEVAGVGIDFNDIAVAVNSFMGLPYDHAGPIACP